MCRRCLIDKNESKWCVCSCTKVDKVLKKNKISVILPSKGVFGGTFLENIFPDYSFYNQTWAICATCKHKFVFFSNSELNSRIVFPPTPAMQEMEERERSKQRIATEKALKPELLNRFNQAVGNGLSESKIKALKDIRNELKSNDVDSVKWLYSNDYIRKRGILSSKYSVTGKGYDVLNWIYYEYKDTDNNIDKYDLNDLIDD